MTGQMHNEGQFNACTIYRSSSRRALLLQKPLYVSASAVPSVVLQAPIQARVPSLPQQQQKTTIRVHARMEVEQLAPFWPSSSLPPPFTEVAAQCLEFLVKLHPC